jgi:hypothetical protein
MADLIERLRARLDEDERVANGVIGERWYFDLIDDGKRAYEDRFTAERQLRWVAAARQILDRHYRTAWPPREDGSGSCAACRKYRAYPCKDVLALASIYGEDGDG